jgi:hypothetical protein
MKYHSTGPDPSAANIRASDMPIGAARCRELSIPSQFAPTMTLYWRHRGYDNSVEKRRHELRGIAEAKVQAIEKKANTEIEMSCLQAQTELTISGLTSEAARGFIEKLPDIDTLMRDELRWSRARLNRPPSS